MSAYEKSWYVALTIAVVFVGVLYLQALISHHRF